MSAALVAVLVVALLAVACGEPVVPGAVSTTADLVVATSVPVIEPTPFPTLVPTPTAIVVDSGDPAVTPVPQPVVAQPGLSSDLIRVAVIFDGETAGAADDLFLDAWLGARAWQLAVNESGGLGGRDVEVVPLDSRLFDHRSALEEVCQGEYFAIIGSHSLGDSDGAELLGTEDCNIADFPGGIYGSRRAASPVTWLSNPFLNNTRQAGPARYLVEKYPEASQNLGLLRYFDLDLRDATERQREMLQAQGMNVVLDLAADLEDGPEIVVNRWDELGAQSLVWTADPGRLIELLEAFEEPPVFVLCEWGCYSQQFLIDGGDAVEGVYAWIPHDPFDSPFAPGELGVYEFMMDRVAPNVGWSEISLQTWMSGRLFEAAFAALTQAEPDAPTREQLIEVARQTVVWTGNGVLSFTNPAAGDPSPCFVLMVVQGNRWVQEFPQPPLDKDCSEDNLYELVTSSTLGVANTSSATSEDPVDSGADAPPDLENPEEIDE